MLVIEELNLRKETSFRRRRHSFLDPMDVRDFLEPDKYHRYESVVRYLKDISTRYPFVELLELGRSHENRSLLAVKIGWSKLGEEYEVGAAADIYYIAGGASDDWFYARTSAKFSFTIELPDDGREFGFLFPAELAPQVGEDIWTSVTSLAIQALALS